MSISLVLADPHPIFRVGLEHLLAAEEDIRVLASCQSAAQALKEVRRHRPDLLLLDLALPDRCGLTLIRELRQERLPCRPVILAAALDDEQTLEALRLGVQGMLLKTMPLHLLMQCLRTVLAGGHWLEKQSTGQVVEKLMRRETETRRLAHVLTPREIEILRLAAKGMSNRQIAHRLTLKEGTVKMHLHHIYEKLGIDGRVELTLYAQKRGLL